MTLLGVLARGRQMANARMTETVRVGVLVETTDENYDVVQVLEPVAYTGRARVKFPSVAEAEVSPGGQVIVKQDAELHLPSGTVVDVDMRVVVDGSSADVGLIGRAFRIKGRPAAGQTTAARYPLEETGEVIAEGS